ncbi:MAG: prepilin peptidase [Actinomycetota bacterium]
MTAALVVLCGIFGLIVGSFLNVVVWRLPRGESVVRPRSHCPACGAGIRPRDEIPVLSWLLLRGRCRDCGTRISGRYPAVETLTAVVFAVLALRFSHSAPAESWRVLPAFLYVGAVGIALALIDLDTHRLPDKLTLPSYGVGAVLLGASLLAGVPAKNALHALAGALIMFGIYFSLCFAYPKGMGFGDVKLAGVLGLYLGWLGWETLAVGLLLGWFSGGLLGAALLATKRAGRKSMIPFGPFMVVGALGAIVFGAPIIRVWLP